MRMKKLFLILIILLCGPFLFAQKTPLNISVLSTWSYPVRSEISNDGKVVIYEIGSTLVIQATDNSFKKEVSNASNACITEDSRHVIYKLKDDSLVIFDPVKSESQIINGVSAFKVPAEGNGQWLTYLRKKVLILRNLFSEEER